MTIPQLFDEWMRTAALPEKSRTRKRRAFRQYLFKLVRNMRVSDLTAERIELLRRALAVDGLTRGSAGYVVADCLAQPLRDAHRRGLIPTDLFPTSRTGTPAEQTFEQFANRWVAEENEAVRRWILPAIGDRPLSRLGVEDEARVRARMQEEGEHPDAIRAVVGDLFGRMWQAAGTQGLAPPPTSAAADIERDESRRSMTVAAWAERWLSTASAPPFVAAYTTAHRRKLLEHYVLPKIGHLRVDRVNTRIASELQAELFRRELSVTSVRHIVSSICGGMFRDARTQGLTRLTPFRGLRWPRDYSTRPDVFSDNDLDAILRHFRTYSKGRWFVWVALLAGTGARPSEIAGLQWGDLDLDGGAAEIRRALVCREETVGKTHRSQRRIGLAADLVDLLRQARPRDASDSAWICTGTDGRPIDSTNWAASKWRPQLAKIGVKLRRLYVLRHTYISRALSAGAPAIEVGDYCGTSLAKISEVYGAWIGDRRADPLSAARQRSEGKRTPEPSAD